MIKTKFEVPEYDLSELTRLNRLLKSKKYILEHALAPSNRNSETGRKIQSEIDELEYKINTENSFIEHHITEFEKKYPGYSLRIVDGDFIVINILFDETLSLIKLYRTNNYNELFCSKTEFLKHLNNNLNKILTDYQIFNNLSKDICDELIEINSKVKDELEIKANFNISPFKSFEKDLKEILNT